MPKQAAVAVENNFKNGFITEATGLNFPEHACTETDNCVFSFDGSVQRRLGIDFEANYATKTIDRTGAVVSAYLWKDVSADGTVNLLVLQVGGVLYFYETTSDSISAGAVSSTITLSTYNIAGLATPETVECQFATGNGLLFVTHPYCKPFYVTYTVSTQTAAGTALTLKIRDLVGDTADANAVDTRPTATLAGLEAHHKYNLYNQGWNTTNLTAWDTSETTMPSNVDVMWSFKNSSDAFAMSTLANVIHGNSPAPKGHFILDLHSQDRDTAAGTSGATATTIGARPRTCAFHAGRVFYAGINALGYNSSIYFSQIAEQNAQFAYCYQQNDPTAEALFDLLPTDGGNIFIHDAGTIFKLVSVPGFLLVFAQNGVWAISGSVGSGFSATDYTVQKISTVNTISATSFVDVGGYPSWWNADGIFIIAPGDNGAPSVKSMTLTNIQSFYDAIPLSCKLTARGYFNLTSKVIQWIYRTEETTTPEDVYTFTNILNFDTRTNAFYPWTPSTSTPTINSIIVLNGSSGSLTLADVVNDSGDSVVNDSGDTVTAFIAANTSVTPKFLYITSYADSGSYKFTMSSERDTGYVDWFSYDDTGVDYTSSFVTGYRLRGQGINKWQSNWITLYSRTTEAVSYILQARWDYSITSSAKRWSIAETISHSDLNYSNAKARKKLRGEGKAQQIKITSVSEQPFDLIGWITFDTINTTP